MPDPGDPEIPMTEPEGLPASRPTQPEIPPPLPDPPRKEPPAGWPDPEPAEPEIPPPL